MSNSTKWFLGILGVLAVVALIFTLLLVAFVSVPSGNVETVVRGSGARIALVELKGVITSSEDFVRQVKKYREDSSIKALLIRVDSPGGAVVPSQEMYEELRKTRDGGKPVVVSMGSLAASGGYYVSCGATKLVANRGTLTGSIGVISEFLHYYQAMNKLGLDVQTIKSGSLKDAGSPNRKMTENDQKYFQALTDDIHRQFVTVVERERHLKHARALELSDGRVFSGEQAVAEGLVDTLGTYQDALRIAADIAGISGEPSVVRERRKGSLWSSLMGEVDENLKDLKQELLNRPIMSYRYSGPGTP
jgi:protease IV